MNNIYLITDTHFNHRKLTDIDKDFKHKMHVFKSEFFALNFDENDILIHLGDVSLGDDEFWHRKITAIKCKKMLVLGNHDNHSIFWYMDKGWDFVCERFALSRYGYKIIFSHEPLRNVKEGYINICGHMHYPELHITNKISLVPLVIYRLDTLIIKYKSKYNTTS